MTLGKPQESIILEVYLETHKCACMYEMMFYQTEILYFPQQL